MRLQPVVSQLPSTSLRVELTMVSSSLSVQNLGFYIDADLRLKQQRLVSQPTDIFKSLVVSLFLSWLVYGNTVLCGLPQYQYRCLQYVLHAAAWSINNLRRCDPVTPALIELDWLSAVDLDPLADRFFAIGWLS